MNSIHVTTRESTLRREMVIKEGDCFDPAVLQSMERDLRSVPYLMAANVTSEPLADGTHRVTIATQDVWALSLAVAFSFDPDFTLNGVSASAKNLFGTGTSVAYFRSTFRDRKRVGGMVRQPNLLGTRVDVTFHGGSTRSGTYYTESLFRPFTGEAGQNAFRQMAHRRDDYFAYSVGPDLGFTQALLRFEAEQYEATYQRRFGDDAGVKFLVGVGASREVVRFPFGAAGAQIVLDDDFDAPIQAPDEVLVELSPQARNHATNRAIFTLGVRKRTFLTMNNLDAPGFLQDIQVGGDVKLTVAPGIPTGSDNASDVLTKIEANVGLTSGRLYMVVDGTFEARSVSSDKNGGPTGWRDVLGEINGTGYFTFSESSVLFSRVLYTRGSRMDRPFQLTLGGREGVRGYNDDAFPGAGRILATVEQRVPLRALSGSIADIGLAGFVDAGRMWAGNVPYGVDTSGWKAAIGAGLRIRLAAAGKSVIRLDLAAPLGGGRGQRVFRMYAELFGLLDRRSWPTQTDRSRWYGVNTDLTTRPLNPLAIH